MVLLAMTDSLAELVQLWLDNVPSLSDSTPSLTQPSKGHPISHDQIIDLSHWLKQNTHKLPPHISQTATSLFNLLKGCSIYIPPQKPPPEKSSEYKALMEKLRRDAELQSYTRMTAKDPSQSYGPSLFTVSQADLDSKDEDITYAEVNRQMAVVLNVLVSIIACGVAIWIAARHWRVEARLALSLVGALVVGVAEVVIYNGYLRRLKEAKATERKKVEVKTIEESWVIEGKKSENQNGSVRHRHVTGSIIK